jgi:opacity protein-like surface antigen
MRALAALFVFAALATPTVAQDMPSATGFYIQAYGGLRVPDNLLFDGKATDLGIGTTFGASVGIDTSVPGLSGELDYMRSSANYSGLGTALDSQSLMLDATFAPELGAGLMVQPYVGAGLGAVRVTYKDSASGTAPAFQLKAGVSGEITGNLSWFGEYRYQQAFGEVGVGADTAEYASHSILGGLKIDFGGGASPSYGGYGGY